MTIAVLFLLLIDILNGLQACVSYQKLVHSGMDEKLMKKKVEWTRN